MTQPWTILFACLQLFSLVFSLQSALSASRRRYNPTWMRSVSEQASTQAKDGGVLLGSSDACCFLPSTAAGRESTFRDY